jgi:cobalamin 5'-phosphate synthase/cobalamin synthase
VKRLLEAVRPVLGAVAFLTRVPVPDPAAHDPSQLGRASTFFPVVGAALGAAIGWTGLVLGRHLPPGVVAVLVLTMGALLTGALHLDGLADTADGLGGGLTREDALRIMRDHSIGTYGAVAVILLLGLEVAALSALPAVRVLPVLATAGAISRAAPVPLLAWLPSARPDGLAAGVGGSAKPRHAVVSSLGATAIAWGLAGPGGLVWVASVAMLVVGAGIYLRHRLGGVTGDTLGAVVALAEALVWVVALMVP